MALATIGYIAFRSPEAFSHPVLSLDDGLLVARMFAATDASPLVSTFAGYISLQTNLLAFLTVKLAPIEAVPFVFAGLSLSLYALAMSVFCLERFQGVLSDARWRAAFCLAMLVLPTHTYNMAATLSFAIWNSALILVFLTVAGFPNGRRALGVELCLRLFFAWSNPLSLTLAPIHLIGVFRHAKIGRRQAFAHLVMLLGLLAYLAFAIQSGGRALDPLLDAYRTIILLFDKGAIELFATVQGLVWLEANDWIWHARASVALILVTGLLIAGARGQLMVPENRWVLVLLVYLAIAFTAIYVVGRRDWAYGEKVMVSARFFYPVKAMVLMFAAILAHRLLSGVSRWRAMISVVAGVPLLALTQAPHTRDAMTGPFQGVYYKSYLTGLEGGPEPSNAAIQAWEWERQKKLLRQVAAGETVRWDRGDASITLEPPRHQ